ncbi:MAG: S1C family serine protease [Proteobacteria bacterium]|nr:S1C family serine protease [Pseudomonadota bacterium]
MTGLPLRLRSLYVAGVLGVCVALIASSTVIAQEKRNPFASIVRVDAEIPPDARTARGLGTSRVGSGIVIDDSGLVLTIGYVILEAMSVTVHDKEGQPVAAEVVAYDYDTGFGLLRAIRPLGIKAMAIGHSASVTASDPVVVADFGGLERAIPAMVVSRHAFAGYWEYLLENAIFTSPPHPNWGGAALIGPEGQLLGVGSLFVNNARTHNEQLPGNMFVPIDLLKPIFAELLTEGRSSGPARPWLGMFSADNQGEIVVTWVAPYGPASKAGVEPGDRLMSVQNLEVDNVPDFYRKLWKLGHAGVEVQLKLKRDGEPLNIVIKSADRYDFLLMKRSY